MKSAAGWNGLRRGLAASATALAVLSGCGGGDSGELPTVPASGTVNYQGKPASTGTVYFMPEKGRPATGQIADGKFTLSTYKAGDGAVVGKHKVSLEVTKEYKDREGEIATKSVIPQKYADPEASKITVDIPAGGKQDIVIDIPK